MVLLLNERLPFTIFPAYVPAMLKIFFAFAFSDADLHNFHADPDPVLHFVADPDPSFHSAHFIIERNNLELEI